MRKIICSEDRHCYLEKRPSRYNQMGSGGNTFSSLSVGGTSGLAPEAPDFLIPLSNPTPSTTKPPKSPKIPKSAVKRPIASQKGRGKPKIAAKQSGKGKATSIQRGKGRGKGTQKGKGRGKPTSKHSQIGKGRKNRSSKSSRKTKPKGKK